MAAGGNVEHGMAKEEDDDIDLDVDPILSPFAAIYTWQAAS